MELEIIWLLSIHILTLLLLVELIIRQLVVFILIRLQFSTLTLHTPHQNSTVVKMCQEPWKFIFILLVPPPHRYSVTLHSSVIELNFPLIGIHIQIIGRVASLVIYFNWQSSLLRLFRILHR